MDNYLKVGDIVFLRPIIYFYEHQKSPYFTENIFRRFNNINYVKAKILKIIYDDPYIYVKLKSKKYNKRIKIPRWAFLTLSEMKFIKLKLLRKLI